MQVSTFSVAELTINYNGLHLTPTEYGLLEALVTNPGKLLTHQCLLRRVWGQGYGTETTYLRTYIRTLRKKLGDDASAPALIVTGRESGTDGSASRAPDRAPTRARVPDGRHPSMTSRPRSASPGAGSFKRVLVGRALASHKAEHQLLPKVLALPVSSSDTLSSVAYATEEMMLALSVAGGAAFAYKTAGTAK